MENAAFVGLSRQVALQRAMDVVAQNVANMSTTGYKAEQVRFREVLTTTDPTAKVGRQIDFVIDQGLVRDMKDGGLSRTGNTYDVAIAGEGYFTIQTPDGPRYTRNGNFTVDNNGRLVTNEGRPVLNTNDQPITIPATAGEVVITGDGTISSANNAISKIKVVTFNAPQNLDRKSDSLYAGHDSDPARAIARPRIIQGTLETSNVQPVVEMTRMIQVQRAYESTKSLVDTTQQMSSDAVRRLGQKGA
jgi:flagellar basal-body rod protein FlgF